ncbi:DUF1440 domain-containing protein [Pseudonocardia nigra]|uniref:DUF1440 domain-containing protein n=1 Tax=Pseudonocardia nigra TaxID=1921578 RepID=UPI001C5D9C8F|nr:DUF1440 domain-containing protein [Pseudonocardia nigra]
MKSDVVKAVSAGAVGVWAMDVVTWWMYRRQDPAALRREEQTRVRGKDTAHAAARRLAELVGSDAARDEPNAAGLVIHYALGIVPAAVYVRQRRSRRWLRAGRGAVYGLLLAIANDEIAGRLLGITGPQRNYPWQAHLRGVVGHVVLGIVTEAMLRALEENTARAPDSTPVGGAAQRQAPPT